MIMKWLHLIINTIWGLYLLFKIIEDIRKGGEK